MNTPEVSPVRWLIRFRCGHRQRRALNNVPAALRLERAALIGRGLCPTCRRIVDHAGHRS